MRELKPAERLIVAVDFKPELEKRHGRDYVRGQVLTLASRLEGTGVCIKLNSVLRACGYELIDRLRHQFGLKVFADLKLVDISETLSLDGKFLQEFRPDIVTAFSGAGIQALKALKAELPDTEVLGITALTSLNDADTKVMFSCNVEQAVMRFAEVALVAGLDGVIASPKEAYMLRAKFGDALSINTPAIRPLWAVIKGDDQNPDRVMTPEKAIKAGANRIVVGRPIVQDANPYDAAMRTIDEIAKAMEAVSV